MLEPAGAADAFDTIEAAEMTDANDARADFDARFALAPERLLRIAGSLVGAEEADDVVHGSIVSGGLLSCASGEQAPTSPGELSAPDRHGLA